MGSDCHEPSDIGSIEIDLINGTDTDVVMHVCNRNPDYLKGTGQHAVSTFRQVVMQCREKLRVQLKQIVRDSVTCLVL
ncbi:terpene synthase; terpene cyclase [Trichuris trichiura]|uniref:Terpene synthase terpene cyclase n=1 Tax=Trichuris trichiura TaxID=36087 RepID=A0A077ZJR5_TRITR|nr:terpene synthase; terpene cyclase [Trichuris trichiura]